MTERLKVEQKEYWVHLEAASSLEKYPGEYMYMLLITDDMLWRSKANYWGSETTCATRAREARGGAWIDLSAWRAGKE
jgi:hypothetical protein